MILGSAIAGLVAGAIHVVSGPDHLSAIAPMAADARIKAWRTGLRWGLGHVFGVGVVATVAVVLRDLLPLEGLSAWSERLVGIVLIGIGIWGLRRALSPHLHSHTHEHGGAEHAHFHTHDPNAGHHIKEAHSHRHAAFAIGTLHGLAGSSHFLAILIALALPNRADILGYLAGYGIGTVASMMVFSTVIGRIAVRFSSAGSRFYRAFSGACAIAAIVIGLFWLTA